MSEHRRTVSAARGAMHFGRPWVARPTSSMCAASSEGGCMEMTTALEGDPTDGTSDKDDRVERRLAAILVADVAGHSRLVGADDAGTLAQWNDHGGALIDPKIAEHHGRVVRIAGDGVLVEFAASSPPFVAPSNFRPRCASVMPAFRRIGGS